MSSAEKDKMEIQNICLQDFGFLVVLLLEHTKSNLRKHHPLCIVLLIAYFVVPTTPNQTFALVIHLPLLDSYHDHSILQSNFLLLT